ncbi:unnamed protein product [Cylicocyclus nassatus]|uniref:Uncharacterized protein n=1 Tax=Cylicocyclus nassatus TaxID=53992 RepID=A0AA36M0T6_CYLNA|nr:unnamed protein product [Cylicocyclus nassatus]
MSSSHDISTTESACSSDRTMDSITDQLSSCSSCGEMQTEFPWNIIDNPLPTVPDFGSLSKDYGQPLIIHFYSDLHGNIVSRIGDFQDVPVLEAVRALNAQPLYTQSINLVVRIDRCDEDEIAFILPTLRLLLFRCRISFAVNDWERCVLEMDDYNHAVRIVEVISEFTDKIFELNIGSVQHVKEQRIRNIIEEEALHVVQLLEEWLPKIYTTLRCCRCLRIFAFIRLDAHLSLMLNRCPMLSHLTLARISEISCPCFNNLQSFEFNGCGMGYAEEDLTLGKCLVKYFPNVRVIGFREVCFDPVISSLIRNLTPTGQRYEIYQIVSTQQFTSLVKSMFAEKYPTECNDHVELVNVRYGTCLIVYGKHKIYRMQY